MGRPMASLAVVVLCLCHSAAGAAAAAAGARPGHRSRGWSSRHLLQKQPESWYNVAPSTHIQGQDPSPEQAKQCGTDSTSFCKICKPVADVQSLCYDFGWCKAFVLDTKDGCSYLKTGAGGLSSGSQFVTYCAYDQDDCQGDEFKYNFYPSADLRDVGDFACNDANPGDAYCRSSGNINEAASSCDASSPTTCNSFVMKEKSGTGAPESFLKSASGPLIAAAHVDVYVKSSADSPEARPDREHPDDKQPDSVQGGSGGQDGSSDDAASRSAPPPSPAPRKKIALGVIIGIAVAGAMLLAGLVALVCCCVVKRKRARREAQGEKDPRALPAYSMTMDSQLGVEDYAAAADKYGDNVKATARVG